MRVDSDLGNKSQWADVRTYQARHRLVPSSRIIAPFGEIISFLESAFVNNHVYFKNNFRIIAPFGEIISFFESAFVNNHVYGPLAF
ncbi:hypothetical protein PoB_004803100 [Plakobranchus ocellatus]|uniref:Uncharacterized protein n=1 Tax=Plakobranchus ocellatus TaxID=259542 RepID=A0AAV4BR43_9GAST|nr:hypothetical protein PoB_004803100 [Plakobranchus ocellatus]